jgi:hypothetical protein
MRITLLASLTTAAVLLLTATPAMAAVTDAEILAARDAMVTMAEAKKLGVDSDSQSFIVTEAKRGRVWLCDLGNTGAGKEVAVKGTRVQYSSNLQQDLGKKGFRGIEQTIYQYPSAKAAKKAYANLTRKLTNCTGSNAHSENGVNYTQSVSNGVAKVKDGDEVAWMLSDGDVTGSWASHDYSVFHLDGDVIVNVELDFDGPGAAKITGAQRKAANELVCDLVHRR